MSSVIRWHPAGAEGWDREAVRLEPGQPPPDVMDLRDLEAPGPFERILEASARLAPGASFVARTPRFPRMLLPHLKQRALAWEVCEEPDGSALVHVRRPG